jgi:hypothetical protein
MTKAELLKAAKNHPANDVLSDEQIKEGVDAYWESVDYTGDDPMEEVDKAIDRGYFNLD